MAFDEFYIDPFQDYMEDLSVKNKLLAHTKVTDLNPNGQRSFSRFQSDEHIAQIVNSSAKNILIINHYTVNRVGDADDKRMRTTVEVRVGSRKDSASGDEQNAINEALRIAEQIVLQIMTRMQYDMEQGCNALEAMEPETMRYDPFEAPWLDNYYGFDFTVSFRSFIPAYNADDWEEEV